MAKSEYEYVREQERDDRLPKFNWILVRINACDFSRLHVLRERERERERLSHIDNTISLITNCRFSKIHNFDGPNDQRPLNLMNASAICLVDQFPDIVLAYGFGPEYSFIWKPTTTFYERRESKILSLTISLFTSAYTMRWKEFFPDRDLQSPPSFEGQVLCLPGPRGSLVRDYLSLRQFYCHVSNQKTVCSWNLIKSGKTEIDVEKYLEGTEESGRNELLFREFGINYNNLPAIFRKGSMLFKDKVEEVVKWDEEGKAVRRTRKKIRVEHEDLSGRRFWKNHFEILPD